MNSTAIQPMQGPDAQIMESVLLAGDLSKLTAAQRVTYYQRTCESLGLNPLTRPFDYITLNGKMTLYAKKEAADQLRKIHGVSIDDVDIKETDTQYIVKVKGHDADGRADVEVGVVNKADMRGDPANVQMKAVTKAKRRLTLSICGLGWLDETEVQTIPTARPVVVDQETGEIAGKIEEWPETTSSQAAPMDYEFAKTYQIKTSKGEKFIGELGVEDLNKVCLKSHDPLAVQAATVVLMADHNLTPPTE